MRCDVPQLGASSLYVSDGCWLDDNTIVLVRSAGMQILMANVDSKNTNCSYDIIDTGYQAERVSCSREKNEFYVTDALNPYVWVYGRSGLKAIWQPFGLPNKPYSLALNSELIAVGGDKKGDLYIYNRERDYLYQVMINENKFRIACSYLTKDGQIMITGSPDHMLVIYDLKDHTTINAGGPGSGIGEFVGSGDVCTAGDSVLVTDESHNKVAVFTLKGKFLHYLDFGGTNLYKPLFMDFSPGKKILALLNRAGNFNNVQMFLLGP